MKECDFEKWNLIFITAIIFFVGAFVVFSIVYFWELSVNTRAHELALQYAIGYLKGMGAKP